MGLKKGPKPIEFQELPVGARFYQHPKATAWDEKIKTESNANVRPGKVNAVGQEGIKSYIYPLKIVWIKDDE